MKAPAKMMGKLKPGSPQGLRNTISAVALQRKPEAMGTPTSFPKEDTKKKVQYP